jgi:hypothetical protein
MSFLEGTFARLQLGRHLENEASFLAGKAVEFTKQVANKFPKSETAMAAKLARLCQKNKLEPADLIQELLYTGKHAELIETARTVSYIQGIGPVDENGDIQVETPEDVVPMARLLFSFASDLIPVNPNKLDQLTRMYERYTANNPRFMELDYRNTARQLIYEAQDQNH